MATSINQQTHRVDDLSGGIQRATTKFQATPSQVDLAINAHFERIGGVEKIKGYSQFGSEITTTSTSTSSSTSTSTSTSSTTTA